MSIGGRVIATVVLLGVFGSFEVNADRAQASRPETSRGAMEAPSSIVVAFAVVPAADEASLHTGATNSLAADELFPDELPSAGLRMLTAVFGGIFLCASALLWRGKHLHGGSNPLR